MSGLSVGPRFSLRGFMLLMGYIAVWLGIVLYTRSSGGMLVLISPYFVVLYLSYRFIRSPFALACAFFAAHTAACAISAAWILQATDNVDRWARSLPIVYVDMPVTFVLAFWEPPGPFGPIYVFVFGGLFWAFVGWRIATLRKNLEDSTGFANRQPEKSLFS